MCPTADARLRLILSRSSHLNSRPRARVPTGKSAETAHLPHGCDRQAMLCFDQLRVLHVSDNELTELSEDVRGLVSLVDLDLSRNQLCILPEALCDLQTLESLNVLCLCVTQRGAAHLFAGGSRGFAVRGGMHGNAAPNLIISASADDLGASLVDCHVCLRVAWRGRCGRTSWCRCRKASVRWTS